MKIFSLNSSKAFGKLVAAELGQSLAIHEERDFEDGEHKIRPLESVRKEDVYVIQSLYGDDSQSANDKMCRLLFFIAALKDASAEKVTAVVPYLCYARKDRRTKPRDPVTTRYIASLFEAVGTDCIVTMDVHNLQAYQNSFRCLSEHLEAKNLFADYFVPLAGDKEVVIMSPDTGGIKRAEQFRQLMGKRLGRELSLVFMEKYRSADNVWGEAVVGNVTNKVVIIIDDLISTGGTLARSAGACKKAGAQTIFTVATHGIFSGNPDETIGKSEIEEIVVGNTIPPFRLEHRITQQKVHVLDVAPLFAKAIKCLNQGSSITELLEYN